MDVLIDTNILLDYVARRKPYCDYADSIFELCVSDKINGFIAAHSITNMFFILRNELPAKERREALLELCNIFTVIGLDSHKLISALQNDNFNDFEDCLQDECAAEFNADYLITRNKSDFIGGKIKAVEPEEFLAIVS